MPSLPGCSVCLEGPPRSSPIICLTPTAAPRLTLPRPLSIGGGQYRKAVIKSCLHGAAAESAYRAQIIERMAGHEAELNVSERVSTILTTVDRIDRADIHALMSKIYPSASPAERFRRQDRLRRTTRALVRRHRDKIERVAHALLQHRTLSGRAIDALLPEIPAPVAYCVKLAAQTASIEVVLDFLKRERQWRQQARAERLVGQSRERESKMARLRWPWDLERGARYRAAKLGYRLHRSRKRRGAGNAGGYALVHKQSSTVVLGSGYTATIEAIMNFVERERMQLSVDGGEKPKECLTADPGHVRSGE